MSDTPPGGLSLATLIHLADLGEAASRRAAPVTRRQGVGNFSATCVTVDYLAKTDTYLDGVTRARTLPLQHERSDEWEERAAILEYEGGWSRPRAEAIATFLSGSSHRDSTEQAMRALDRELIDLERGRR